MPKVLFVNRYTGDYTFSNVDGEALTVNESSISSNDVSVLIERIKAGYVVVPEGMYVVALESNAKGIELTHLLDVKNNAGGDAEVLNHQLIAKDYLEYTQSLNQVIAASSAIAVFDLIKLNLQWISNPMLDQPLIADYRDVPYVDLADDDMVAIQTLGTRIVMRDKTSWIRAVKVNFLQG